MLKSACCYLCLSVNKRTTNIYKTHLQYVYENLAHIKLIDNECWMCYICHTRLQQCLRLQQLAVQTRGLIDDLCQNKINIEFGAFGSLLELTIFKAKNISTTYITAEMKTQPSQFEQVEVQQYTNNDEESLIELENDQPASDAGCNQDLLNVDKENALKETHQVEPYLMSNTKNTSSCYIKLEPEVKMEPANDDGFKQQIEIDIHQYTYNYDQNEQLSIEFEDPLMVGDSGCKQNVMNNESDTWQESEEFKLNIVKMSQSIVDKYVRQTATHTTTEEYLQHGGEQTTALLEDGQSIGSTNMTQDMQTMISNKGIKQDKESEKTSNCIPRGCTSKRQSRGHKQPLSCDVCLWTFSCKSKLQRHVRTHTGEKPYNCDICGKKFSYQTNLKAHMVIHTGNKPFICEICSKPFLYKSVLMEHVRTHTGEEPFSCEICGKKFKRKSVFNAHILTHKGDKPFSCDICLETFSHRSQLKHHVGVVHKDHKPYSCDVCSRKFLYKSKLLQHVKTHTGEEPFNCEVCNKKYLWKSQLLQHVRVVHEGEKPYSCTVCERKFSYKHVLNEHFKTHTGEKPYSCEMCYMKFTQSHHLREHMVTHEIDKVHYNCHICTKKFLHKSGLNSHIRQHNGDQPFSCEFCPMKFVFRAKLNAHMRTHIKGPSAPNPPKNHSDDKQFCCDYCSWEFSRKSDLIEHIRTHTGEKPYRCHFCQKVFSRKSNLRVHLRRHTGDKRFSCEVCPQKFVTKDHLNRHIFRHHPSHPPCT